MLFIIYMWMVMDEGFTVDFVWITWNVDRSRLANVRIKLNVAAAKEMVRGGMHSPVIKF